MRVLAPFVVCCALAGTAYCEDPAAPFEDRSLLDLLAAEKVISYHHDNDSGTFSITLLSDATKERVRRYYDDGGAIADRYNRLRQSYNDLLRENRSEDRGERNQSGKRLAEMHQKMSELRRPNDIDLGARFAIAASVTRYGTDYLVVRELHSLREVLMPLHRIAMVTNDAPIAEPSHSTEPAVGPVSSGQRSAPAR